MIAPEIEKLYKELAGSVVFLKVDIEEWDLRDVVRENFKGVPTFSLFKKESKVNHFSKKPSLGEGAILPS